MNSKPRSTLSHRCERSRDIWRLRIGASASSKNMEDEGRAPKALPSLPRESVSEVYQNRVHICVVKKKKKKRNRKKKKRKGEHKKKHGKKKKKKEKEKN